MDLLEKKGQRAKTLEKREKVGKRIRKRNKKINERGLYLRILPRRNSFDDKPMYKVSSCTVQNCFGQSKENISVKQVVIHLT